MSVKGNRNAAHLPFKPYVIDVQTEGEDFKFLVGNHVGKEWYDTDHTEPRMEMRFIRDHLIQRGNLVVECGCHHGFTSILLSKWVGPQGKIIAFEANPRNAAIALKNMKLNSIGNVDIHMTAVGNHAGTLNITGLSNSKVESPLHRGELEVAAVRLDDFPFDRIPDLIKIDVEGYELEVIRGFHSTLAIKETILAIEVHLDALRNYGGSFTDLCRLIGLEDYKCWLGVGDQANDQIRRYTIGRSLIPRYSRAYLFATPRNRVI